MKSYYRLILAYAISSLNLNFIALSLTVLIFLPRIAIAEEAYVQVRNASLQAEPALLAKSLKKLSYGEALRVITTSSGWAKVSSAGQSGFVHLTAISPRKLTLSSKTSPRGSVDDSDISLAGKGFSPEIEKQLAASNGELNFNAVDTMEKLTVSSDQIKNFLKSGNLMQGNL